MTTLYTDDGQKIRLNAGEQPKWNDFHKRYYVWGYRWIKSRRAWSKNRVLYNFAGWSTDERAPEGDR